ncbi:MAG TPA: hypothetical protein VIL71_08105 [Spirillospora sp.]
METAVGRQPNRTLHTLKTLATFFRVPIGHFDDGEEAERLEKQLALMRGGGVDNATLRTLASLSPEGRHMISEIIASAARMEKLRTLRDGKEKETAIGATDLRNTAMRNIQDHRALGFPR